MTVKNSGNFIYMCALKKWKDVDIVSFLHRPDIHQNNQG